MAKTKKSKKSSKSAKRQAGKKIEFGKLKAIAASSVVGILVPENSSATY
jgi:hypothetical protein